MEREIVPPSFDYGFALSAMKRGKPVSRRSWGAPANLTLTSDGLGFRRGAHAYLPTTEDQLADDWHLIGY